MHSEGTYNENVRISMFIMIKLVSMVTMDVSICKAT